MATTRQATIFDRLLTINENRQCADCTGKWPTWASTRFGTLVCDRCAGFHRHLGTHITKVKSTKLDKWDNELLDVYEGINNELANEFWEYKLPAGFKRPIESSADAVVAQFIKDKYVSRAYVPKGAVDPVEEFRTGQRAPPLPPIMSRPVLLPPKQTFPSSFPAHPPAATSKGVLNSASAHDAVPPPAKKEPIRVVAAPAPAPTPAAPVFNQATMFDFDSEPALPPPPPPTSIRLNPVPSATRQPVTKSPIKPLQPTVSAPRPEESKSKPTPPPPSYPVLPQFQQYGSCPTQFQYPIYAYPQVPFQPQAQCYLQPNAAVMGMMRAFSDSVPNAGNFGSVPATAAPAMKQNIPREKLDRMVPSFNKMEPKERVKRGSVTSVTGKK